MNDAQAVVAAQAAQQEDAAAAAKERRAAKKKARAGSTGPQPQSSRKAQDTTQEQLGMQKGNDQGSKPLQSNHQALRPLPEPEPEPEPGPDPQPQRQPAKRSTRQHTSAASSVCAPVPAKRLPLPDYGVKTVLAVCEDVLLLREGITTSSVHVSFTEGLDQLIFALKERMPLRPGLVVALWHDRFGDGEHGVATLCCAPVVQLTPVVASLVERLLVISAFLHLCC